MVCCVDEKHTIPPVSLFTEEIPSLTHSHQRTHLDREHSESSQVLKQPAEGFFLNRVEWRDDDVCGIPGVRAVGRQVRAAVAKLLVQETFSEYVGWLRGGPLRELDFDLDRRDDVLPERAQLFISFFFFFFFGTGRADRKELMSAEGTSAAAPLRREPGGDALEAKLVATRKTNRVLGGICLVTDGTAIAIQQIGFRDGGELGYDVLCHCSRLFRSLVVAETGNKRIGWEQDHVRYVVANRDSLRFRSSGLSGGRKGLGWILAERV